MVTLRTSTTGHLANVRPILQQLDKRYSDSNLGNFSDPLDELVYIILSIKTSEKRYLAAFKRVRSLLAD